MVPTRLASLPLPPSVLQRLALAGYETRADLDGLTPDELGVDLGIEASSATLLLRTVRGECVSAGGGGPWLMPRDALSMYEEERAEQRISTCAGELDRLLAGGVQLQKLSEFSGVPGVGKTQLAMQLALAVQLPEALNGLDGDTIYIDDLQANIEAGRRFGFVCHMYEPGQHRALLDFLQPFELS
jgi:hypothetical protein